jgi:hypothetical protein
MDWVSLFLQSLNGLFDWRKTVSANQATHEIIDDKKDLQRACNYAELALELVQSKATFASKRDEKRFQRMIKKFRRYK